MSDEGYDIVIGKELGCKSSAEEYACQGESEFAHPFENLVAGAAARHFVTIGVTGPDVEADKYGEEDHEDEVLLSYNSLTQEVMIENQQ